MVKRRRRRRSIVVLLVVALGAGAAAWIAATAGRPETVRAFAATATWHRDGTASVVESIDYFFPQSRHGIYRELPGVPWATADDTVQVRSDHTNRYSIDPDTSAIQARMDAENLRRIMVDATQIRGVRVRIGDPNRTVSGLHHYEIAYPLTDAELGDGRIGWDGVGASWDVPIERTRLDLVAPWRWEKPTCDVGTTGSIGGCRVDQVVAGHLVVSHGRLASGEGITVYARAGAPLAKTPEVGPTAIRAPATPFWQRAGVIAGAVVIAFFGSALLVAWLLRRVGRDWVMGAPAAAGAATDIAFASRGLPGEPSGAVRVDDARLDDWVATEFAPPKGLKAWQGGILAAEGAGPDQQVAWLLEAAADGHVELDDTDGTVKLNHLDHPNDATSALLATAFAGRDQLALGRFDPSFASMWASLGALQKRWLDSSAFVDHRGEGRVVKAVVFGVVAAVAATVGGIAMAASSYRVGVWAVVGTVAAALLGGAGAAAALRAWELHVRTPAGTAMWLRIEGFRRFLAASEAEHVRQAASRGVLREYTAWAVALGEVDRWNAAVQAAGLPVDTVGLNTAAIAPQLGGACRAAGTTPSSSGGSGGGGGVGGGGGGGGGGSW